MQSKALEIGNMPEGLTVRNGKISLDINAAVWLQTEYGQHVKVKHRNPEYGWVTTTPTLRVDSQHWDNFTVDIDLAALVRMMVGRAIHTKSGKSSMQDGIVEARRHHVGAEVSREEVALEIGPDYELAGAE